MVPAQPHSFPSVSSSQAPATAPSVLHFLNFVIPRRYVNRICSSNPWGLAPCTARLRGSALMPPMRRPAQGAEAPPRARPPAKESWLFPGLQRTALRPRLRGVLCVHPCFRSPGGGPEWARRVTRGCMRSMLRTLQTAFQSGWTPCIPPAAGKRAVSSRPHQRSVSEILSSAFAVRSEGAFGS